MRYVFTFPTFKLLNPGTNVAKVFEVDTSRKYSVAPAEAFQLALIETQSAAVPAKAVGTGGIEFIVSVLVEVAFVQPRLAVAVSVSVTEPAVISAAEGV
jgi:hypothetical protein